MGKFKVKKMPKPRKGSRAESQYTLTLRNWKEREGISKED